MSAQTCERCGGRRWICITCDAEPGHENCPCGYGGFRPCEECNDVFPRKTDPHDAPLTRGRHHDAQPPQWGQVFADWRKIARLERENAELRAELARGRRVEA